MQSVKQAEVERGAAAVLLPSSDVSAFTTGSVLAVDGAYLAF